MNFVVFERTINENKGGFFKPIHIGKLLGRSFLGAFVVVLLTKINSIWVNPVIILSNLLVVCCVVSSVAVKQKKGTF